MITKEMIKEVLDKADYIGEQLVPINLDIDDGDFALSIASIRYHHRDCYELGLDARHRDTGEPEDINAWLILGKDLLDYMIYGLTDESLAEIVNDIKDKIVKDQTEEEQVPAE